MHRFHVGNLFFSFERSASSVCSAPTENQPVVGNMAASCNSAFQFGNLASAPRHHVTFFSQYGMKVFSRLLKVKVMGHGGAALGVSNARD